MIKITKAKGETRKRDLKRNRVLLQVGKYKWHLTKEEMDKLADQLDKLADKLDKLADQLNKLADKLNRFA
jgi:X-X-X-Leu-X-X-Gly heptad repeat protein